MILITILQLTNLLIIERIINVGSLAHQNGVIDFDDLMMENKSAKEKYLSMAKGISKPYANSKLANLMFTMELAERLKGTGVTSYCLCPGMVFTDVGRNIDVSWVLKLMEPIFKILLKSPSEVTFYL